MALLYNEIDTKYFVYQPNMVRSRQRYKGPRDSAKINLEIQQYLYDMGKVYKRSAEVINDTVAYAADIVRGTTFDDIEFSWENDATPGVEPVFLEGFIDLAAKVEGLRQRIIKLELNNG